MRCPGFFVLAGRVAGQPMTALPPESNEPGRATSRRSGCACTTPSATTLRLYLYSGNGSGIFPDIKPTGQEVLNMMSWILSLLEHAGADLAVKVLDDLLAWIEAEFGVGRTPTERGALHVIAKSVAEHRKA